MTNNQSLDPKLQHILGQIANFGFTFYGLDENGAPLVTGPNKQIVPINVAISFVNQQIQSRQNSSSIESGVVETADTTSKVESSTERSIETKLETPKEQSSKSNNQQSPVPIPQKSPKVILAEPKKKPYGDGFDPKSFDPADINSTLKFIEKNQSQNPKSSNRWIAEQFKKFIADYTKKS
jgi:hypothetical protein